MQVGRFPLPHDTGTEETGGMRRRVRPQIQPGKILPRLCRRSSQATEKQKVNENGGLLWTVRSKKTLIYQTPQAPNRGQVIHSENGTQYFVCENNRIKISEHSAAGGKSLGNLILDVVRYIAEKADHLTADDMF